MAGKIDFQPINWSRQNQMRAVDNAFARIEQASMQAMVPEVEKKQTFNANTSYSASTQSRSDSIGMFFDRFA